MKQVTFVFTVNAVGAEGLDHPRFAYFQVTQSFLDRLDEICGVLKDYNLSEAREYSGAEYENEDEFRLDSHELVVTPSNTWFRATIKHTDADVETRGISPSQFDDAFEKSEDDAIVFFGDDCDKEEAVDWYREAFAELDT
jgi:hypothetical protein